MKIQRFSVYDKVWVMTNNQPQEMMIYSVTHTMNTTTSPHSTNISYMLVKGVYGNATSINPAIIGVDEKMFSTKEALIDSL